MISVVMSTYKEPIEYIEQSINSILNQTYRDIEFVIIVDNPDNAEHIEYIQNRMSGDSRIKLSINEKNCGLTESLNRAIALARGTFIARMDADDIAEVDRLECQLAYLIENNLDLVGCNMRDMDENGNIIQGAITRYPTLDGIIKNYLKTNSAVPHPTWLVRKSVYLESGFYCDFPACEDYEFLTRIAIDGKRLGNVCAPKLRYRINSAGISCSKRVSQKTSLYYVRKNYLLQKKSNLVDFQKFLLSEEGKRKQERLRRYYEQSDKLKSFRRSKKKLAFIILGVWTFINLKEGRTVIANLLRERILQLRNRKHY